MGVAGGVVAVEPLPSSCLLKGRMPLPNTLSLRLLFLEVLASRYPAVVFKFSRKVAAVEVKLEFPGRVTPAIRFEFPGRVAAAGVV